MSTSVSTTGRAYPMSLMDVEHADASTLIGGQDPFSLKAGIKTDSELRELKQRNRSGRKVEVYQRGQNELIGQLLKPMEEHTADAKQAEEAAELRVKIAVWASLIGNGILFVLQVYAAVSSLSISLIATGVDSVFDVGSNALLYWLHKKALRLDQNKWPVGGSRLETIGNIVYGTLMGSVNLIVVVEAVRRFVSHSGDETNKLHVPALVAVGAALGVKFLLFLYCFSLRKSSSQVMVLWEDHRNDIFVNSFGLLMSAGGSKLRWWLDPTGGLILAVGVILLWSRTIYKQFELLAGKSAPHDFLQLVIYKALTFSDEIEKLDTVRAYHSGPNYFVEVDVVMSGHTPLWRAHDISQQLQDKLEALPGVERAFVHVDHEITHRPEHRKNM